MLKLLLLTTFVLFTQANIHKFFAENHYICNACQEIVSKIGNGKLEEATDICRGSTKKEFIGVCSKLRGYVKSVKMMLSAGLNYEDICNSINMCDKFNDEEYASQPAINQSIIDTVNSNPTSSWKAGVNERFIGWTLADVRRTLGTIVDQELVYKLPLLSYDNKIELPTDFDARVQWPQCADLIGHVRDQSSCGCCWAFGSTESWNDRLCISNSTHQQLLSVEDTCGCCNGVECGFSQGCNGGQPSAAWSWFTKTGVVSGGDYDDIGGSDTCAPFTLPPCAHHVNSSEYAPCPSQEYPTPACKKECSNTKYPKTWAQDGNYAKTSYQLNSINDIIQDIYSYGSTSGAFTVYEDFLSYKSGVYVHKTGQELGGHAIKIFGWGIEDGQDYWLCANSWNDSWGDNGFFKILKGVNECGIESDVTGGRAN